MESTLLLVFSAIAISRHFLVTGLGSFSVSCVTTVTLLVLSICEILPPFFSVASLCSDTTFNGRLLSPFLLAALGNLLATNARLFPFARGLGIKDLRPRAAFPIPGTRLLILL